MSRRMASALFCVLTAFCCQCMIPVAFSAVVVLSLAFQAVHGAVAVDLEDSSVRAAQPKIDKPSYAGEVVSRPGATGGWAYRLRTVKSWVYGLPFVPYGML